MEPYTEPNFCERYCGCTEIANRTIAQMYPEAVPWIIAGLSIMALLAIVGMARIYFSPKL